MRSLSSGLMSVVVVACAVAGSAGEADARGGAGGAARAGGGVVQGGVAYGGRGAYLRSRFGGGDRFGRGRAGGRFGYGFGYAGSAYAQYGDEYGSPYGGSFRRAYDRAPPTSIGIPPSPVAPPAIYVLGEPGRAKASGAALHEGRASRKPTPRSSEDDRVVAGGPRIIRITR